MQYQIYFCYSVLCSGLNDAQEPQGGHPLGFGFVSKVPKISEILSMKVREEMFCKKDKCLQMVEKSFKTVF